MARAARIASVALITAGLVILADAGLTIVWKEPVSSVLAAASQSDAEDQLDQLRNDFAESAPPLRATGSDRNRIRALARQFAETIRPGRGIGRIRIPAIGIDFVVVNGTDTETLKKGPGFYPETSLPGLGRTTGIAGHRTTYLAPFHDIDKLERGDEIFLEMPYANFLFEVTRTQIVTPDRVDVVDDVGRDRLVLTACHPLYSAAERYVIFADLERAAVFGPLGGRWQDP